MRVLHCCLASFYIDNYGYQENILPKMHKLQGHDVMILASTETYLENKKLGYVTPSSYLTEDSIPIKRVPYIKWLPAYLQHKLRIYNGTDKVLCEFQPDLIFMHDCQTAAVFSIIDYIRKNKNTTLFVDSHTDCVNSAKNFVSKYILHGLIYKWYIKQIVPYTNRFYGTLPIRELFLTDFYDTPKGKTNLLPFGVDTTNIDFSQRESIRKNIRENLSIAPNDIVLITGGKIDHRKNIHLLLEAIFKLECSVLKLILFGQPTDEMKQEIEWLVSNSNKIIFVGWLPASETYKYFFAADLAIFPGTHSTLWEESLGLGLPAIFKRWNGMEHVDMDGNAILLDEISIESLTQTIFSLINTKDQLKKMSDVAKLNENMKKFDYYEIAKKAIEQ